MSELTRLPEEEHDDIRDVDDLTDDTGKSRTEVTSAPQWQLIWWRFRKHRMVRVGLILLVRKSVV